MIDYRSTKQDIKISEYILFLNSLNLKTKIVDIVSIHEASEDCLMDWIGIKSIVCMNDRQELYDIDIRFAWGDQIFKQHLYDFGWNQSNLLCSKERRHKSRRKLIIYLCAPSTTLVESMERSVPAEFIIGKYWKSIDRFYLLLPLQHPFDIPDFVDTQTSKYSLSDFDLPTVVRSKRGILEGGLRTKGIDRSGTIDRPLISVITVVFNGEKNLEQTIQSVINQDCQNFEYIIIDGGSTDRSTDIIKKYESQIDYWKSEKDMGLYDAMNQGIDLASGQWLNFMNCGDFFYSHQSLSRIPLKPNVDFYYSDTILYDGRGKIELRICAKEKQDVIHQSIVYGKHLHSNYKYLVHDKLSISDYFFFRKNDSKNWQKLDLPLSIYNTEGLSGTNPKGFIQRLFVEFMAGDITEFQMSLLIMAKVLRTPLRIIRDTIKKWRS
jgi:hypothetical protein